MTLLTLVSPLSGWASGLEEAPDDAFASGMVGDGLVVDPTDGWLRAPCDGEVTGVAPTGHSIALRSLAGADILMHVGIDTVRLNGAGFNPAVALGQPVRVGDLLLSFDLDRVARGARSLITPILVTNLDRFEIVRRQSGLVQPGDLLMEIRPRDAVDPGEEWREGEEASTSFVTGLADGVHARPAARIVAAARELGVDVIVWSQGRSATARSALGLMGLGIRNGERVTLQARGAGAQAAIALLRPHFEPRAELAAKGRAGQGNQAEADAPGRVLVGVRGSGGLAVGPAFRHSRPEAAPPETNGGVDAETAALEAAIAAVRLALRTLAERPSGAQAEVMQAHLALLDDPALGDDATARLRAGASAGAAWRGALRHQAGLLARLGDGRMAERGADLLDLERQVLAQLYGAAAPPPAPPPGSILLADELLPSELAALDGAALAGLAMSGGGATSHVAIIAASLGLPALMATPGLDGVPDGAALILDADGGRLIVEPDEATLAAAAARSDRRRARRHHAVIACADPALTLDGVEIAVLANLGGPAEAQRAVANGADGCGLLRSEFLFHGRDTPPGEEEQRAAYQAMADHLDGRPLTIRTLDIGADKPAPYLALPPEANPALGLRGVRVSLARPDLLRSQLRAILRVRAPGLSLMAPMVASLHEIAAVGRMLRDEAQALGVAALPLGVMVETPAAALTIGALAQEAAFFSIGVNDLTQYVLAMDRNAPALAKDADSLHPAVVALIGRIAEDAAAHDRPVSVCGGLAADAAGLPLLIGLGVRRLSVPPSDIAQIKASVRALSAQDCRDFALAAARFTDAAGLRAAVAKQWPQTGDAA